MRRLAAIMIVFPESHWCTYRPRPVSEWNVCKWNRITVGYQLLHFTFIANL